QEQRHRGDDQETGKIINLLRPKLDEEEIETSVGKIDEHSLTWRIRTAIPPDEGHQVIDAEAKRHQRPFDFAERALDALRIDFLAGNIERPGIEIGWTDHLVHRRHLPPPSVWT